MFKQSITLAFTVLALAGSAQASAKTCKDCGKVTRVQTVKQDGKSNAAGVVGGGVVGGLLGNQVGSGSGRALATVAGAVGGAYAGKRIQEKSNSYTVWVVDVKYNNGRHNTARFSENPGLRTGDRVRGYGQNVRRY